VEIEIVAALKAPPETSVPSEESAQSDAELLPKAPGGSGSV